MAAGLLRRHWKWLTAIVVVAGAWTVVRATTASGAVLATAEVTRGDYVDVVEVRGDVRPVRSLVVTAPQDAGELTIVSLARNGSDVKKGDVVAQFDAITLRRTIQERQSELRGAEAELKQTAAQARIVDEQQSTNVMRAEYDVQRAELGLVETGLMSEVEAERARLALLDAKQRLAEAEAAAKAARAGAQADVRARARRIEKVSADLARASDALSALKMIAPADGTVNILPNYRTSSPMAQAQEYRAGDRTPPRSPILELPDLTSVYLTARIDEGDRGQLHQGLEATVRADAIPDREYIATVTDVSVLARVDFTAGWPLAKMFDLKLTFKEFDARLRPGMSAVARIPIGRVTDVLLIPAAALFTVDGRPVVYVERGGAYTEVDVQVIRRGRDQVALSSGVDVGDRVTLTQPGSESGTPTDAGGAR
jgi:multidrug efflux pump subunit AcrA (membrane-fusion protein)